MHATKATRQPLVANDADRVSDPLLFLMLRLKVIRAWIQRVKIARGILANAWNSPPGCLVAVQLTAGCLTHISASCLNFLLPTEKFDSQSRTYLDTRILYATLHTRVLYDFLYKIRNRHLFLRSRLSG